MAGLILFVIVGAWLAVLVPMALKSHDRDSSLRSADRFSDAMRVLSRKSARDVLVPRRPYASFMVSETKSPRPAPQPVPAAVVADVPTGARRMAARRRLRTLLVLLATASVTLALGVFVLRVLLVVHLACDLLLVAFAIHLRRQAIAKAERDARAAHRARQQERPSRRTTRIAGIPNRMPTRPAPLTAPLPAPAARYEDFVATGTDGTGGTWSPVPVPPPTYVGKATAPRREPRVLDLTKPGQWMAALEEGDSGLDILEQGPELEEIIERRRAVND